jgi:translation initiation factor 1
MSRPKETRKKMDAPAPLQSNPFAVLGELDALKNLAPAPQAEKPKIEGLVQAPPPKKKRGRLVLRRETKERGGKVVVVVSGLAEVPGSSAVMIAGLARELKGKLGCGGSFDRREIVLQGDRCAAVCALLEELGFAVAGVRE